MIKKSSFLILMLALVLGLARTGFVRALDPPPTATCVDGTVVSLPSSTTPPDAIGTLCASHGGYRAPVANQCTEEQVKKFQTDNCVAVTKNDCQDANLNQNNCAIVKYLQIFIRVLSSLVGIIIVISIIAGGIQYSSAGDNPQSLGAAKNRIRNALIALVVFIFMLAFLNWVVPGGVFSSPSVPAGVS